MKNGGNYDLKVGYSCNNKCIHCVIEENVKHIKERKGKIDRKYSEIIKMIDSEAGERAGTFVITGGEPTIRREFKRIIDYIVKKYPNKKINIQTNGRNLKEYISYFNSISNKINYTIALHSMEEKLHNKITGDKNGNPFIETMKSIEEIKKVYDSFEDVARIEIVLSSWNIEDLFNMITKMYDKGIKNIGISYPHFDGKYESDPIKTKEISFSYKDLKKQIIKIIPYLNENKDLELSFEQVPRCMWRDQNNKLIKIPKNVSSLDHDLESETVVSFPDYIDENFNETFIKMHKKTEKCTDCVLNSKCLGVWYEAVEMFKSEGFIPIKKEELDDVSC